MDWKFTHFCLTPKFFQRRDAFWREILKNNESHYGNSNIIGAIEVVKYFLKQISTHRYQDFCKQIDVLLDGVENDNVAEILNDITGFDMNFA